MTSCSSENIYITPVWRRVSESLTCMMQFTQGSGVTSHPVWCELSGVIIRFPLGQLHKTPAYVGAILSEEERDGLLFPVP